MIAALPLFLGLHPLTFLPRDQWDWAIIPVSIGLVFVALGVWFWRRRPINAASVTFRDMGFRLDVRQVFRGEGTYDVDWAGVGEVTKFDGGLYGGRQLSFVGHDGRKIASFSAAWTDCSGGEVLNRLRASAEVAGYEFIKRPLSFASLFGTRWAVQRRTEA